MICRGNSASSTATHVASVTFLIWHVHQAHQPPAEDVAKDVGIGGHRGDADYRLDGGGIDPGRHEWAFVSPMLVVFQTETPTPKKSRSLLQIASSSCSAAASTGQSG